MSSLRRAVVGTVLAVATVGCAAPPPDPPAPAPDLVFAAPAPVAVSVDAIGAVSTLVPTGIEPDGQPEVPPVTRPEQASWYCPPAPPQDVDGCDWPMPGELGPAALLGHRNGAGRVGVFARIEQLQAGAEVVVQRDGAAPLVFVVYRVEQIPKVDFRPGSEAIARVYGPTPGPELRLLTCGGDFDQGADSYLDQVVAYAALRDP